MTQQAQKRFLVLGGHLGDTNGKPWFLPAHELVRLYKLSPEECVCIDSAAMMLGKNTRGLILLRPVADGDYERALRDAQQRA